MNPFPTLLNPSYLYLLLGIPVLFLLLFSHKKYQEISIPHLPLLLEVLKENRLYYATHQNLKWLQFFIFLGILISLSLAASFPAGGKKEWKERYFQAVIDLSPSGMVQEKGKKLRIDQVKEQLRHLILLLKPKDHLMLITAAETTKVLSPYTTEKKQLLQAIKDLTPQASPANLTNALALVEKVKATGSHTFLFSDGAANRSAICEKAPAIFISAGQSEVNLGLRDVSFASLHHADVLMVKVFNYSQSPQLFRLIIQQNNTPLYLGTCQLKGLEMLVQNIPLRLQDLSPLQVEIDCVKDSFPYDNATTIFVPLKTRIVALSSLKPLLPALSLFQNRFQAKESIQITPTELAQNWQPGDLVFMNGGSLKELPTQGNYVLFGTTGWEETEKKEKGVPKKDLEAWLWNRSHPLNQYCSFEWLFVKAAQEIRFPNSIPLIRARTGEILCAEVFHQQAKILYFPFTLEDSNLITLATFPLFLANILSWAIPQENNSSRIPQSFRYPNPILFADEGHLKSLDQEMNIPFKKKEPLKNLWPGLYLVETSTEKELFVYHPYNENFSNIRPTPGRIPRFGLWLSKESPNYREYWEPFVWIALLLVFFELILYGSQLFLQRIP